MSEPVKPLQRLDELTPTDLWSDIEHRTPGPDPRPPVPRSRRVLVIVVAFTIAAAAIALPLLAISRPKGGDFTTAEQSSIRPSPEDGASTLATACFGYKVDIYAVEDGVTYEGSPGDDIVVQRGTAVYHDNGGIDVTCTEDGEPIGISVDGSPELMHVYNPQKLEVEVRKLIDAEPYPLPGRLTGAEAVSLIPFDRDVAVELGWPSTVPRLQERAIAWYQEQDVANAPVQDLERALAILTNAIGKPPSTGEPPAETLYITEMVLRREAVCRSLPASPLRDEYCSATSVPNLSERAVIWRDPPSA